MDDRRLDGEKLQMLIAEIIKLEKNFINDKMLSEKNKIQELKKLIEKEVKPNVD